eukprot:1122721-Prorocentrum_minimum.AAC.1
MAPKKSGRKTEAKPPSAGGEKAGAGAGATVDAAAKARAQEFKAAGNTAFSAGKYEEAINQFTLAILEDGTDQVFYSNRSACYANLGQFDRAADDGQKCITLKPDWVKVRACLCMMCPLSVTLTCTAQTFPQVMFRASYLQL